MAEEILESTVILVRHAEKAREGGKDPALSAQGSARAQSLAAALGQSGVGAIFTSPLSRTQLTAQPLARALGLESHAIGFPKGEASPTHAEAVAAAVRAEPAGSVVLVVGHSNTVPAIIKALGGPELPDLCESEFSRLFVLMPGSRAKLLQARYGEPDLAGCD